MIRGSSRLLVPTSISPAVTVAGLLHSSVQHWMKMYPPEKQRKGTEPDDKKYKVIVTNPEVPKAGLDLMTASCDLVICEHLPLKRSEVLEKVKGVHGMLWACKEPLNAEILDAAGPQVKAISVITCGFDFVDVSELKKRKIALGHTPMVVNDAVANMAIGLALAASRRFQEGREKILTSTCENFHLNWMLGIDLSEAIIGFLGFGGIGQTIARRLNFFDIGPILYSADQPVSKEIEAEFCTSMVPFEELQAKSDFLFNVAPLTADTAGIFNADVFARMKDTAVFVNVGRGGSVNHTDLCHALETRQIFAAGVDVMSPEPFPADHPLMCLPNFIATPHLGASTHRTRLNMARMAAKNVLQGLAGKPMIAHAYT